MSDFAEKPQLNGHSPASGDDLRAQKRLTAGIIAGLVLLLAAAVGLIYFLLLESTPTATIRDIAIIFLALELVLVGLALGLLIFQLAKLVNLVNNEVRPVLDSANEAVNTLRGTATFISDNLAEPVFKLNAFMAGARRLFGYLDTIRDLFK